jgi:uncharacterized protein involved in exopolysaccharide biosynthesis
VRHIWAYRFYVLTVALVCAAASAWLVLSAPLAYEASVTLVVSQSKVGDRPDLNAAMSVATFRPLIESKNVAATVIKELALSTPQRYVSPTTFFGSVITVEEVRGSPVILVKAVLDDPALAASTANLVAERAVALSRGVSQQEALRAQNDLQQQRDEAKTGLERATENLRAFQEKSQAELVRKDVESIMTQRLGLLGMLIQIEGEKAKLAVAERELAGRQRIGTIKRSIDQNAALIEVARPSTDSPKNLLSVETNNEYVDQVYENLDNEAAKSRSELASLERMKSQIVDVRKLDAAEVKQLTKLYNIESELTRLTVERDLATAVYRQVATAYETARVQVSSRSAQLEVLDRAVVSDQPIPRYLARTVVLAFVIGLVLASFAALLHSMLTGGSSASLSRSN